MNEQRAVFLEVLDWVIGEFVAQRSTNRWSSSAARARSSQVRRHRRAVHQVATALYATLQAELGRSGRRAWTPRAEQAINFMTAMRG